MKVKHFKWGLWAFAGVLILLHWILLQVVQKTRVMEKLLATQATDWEMLLIIGFLVIRFTLILFLPPALLVRLSFTLLRTFRNRG